MLNYETDGHGPPLLMVHGFGISFHIWNEMRPLLRDHFTLIMVEMPGIGHTPPPEPGQAYLDAAVSGMEQVRLCLGIDRWRVLSYSSGTRAAEHYLSLHADRVERAVFLCPAEVNQLAAAALRTAIRVDRHFPQVGNWVLSGSRFKFLLELLGFNLRRNPLTRVWFEEMTSQPMNILKETLRTIPGGGAPKFRLPADLPILFVWGRRDLITGSPRKAAGNNMIVRATHSAPETAAQEVAQVILPFLK
jgi:pimeloyl-ACP methyl ester carboxylesterase